MGKEVKTINNEGSKGDSVMEDRIKFLNEVSKKVVNDEKKISLRTIKESDYKTYAKKFFGVDKKTLKKIKEINDSFINDTVKIAADDLVEDSNVNESQVIGNMGTTGRLKTRFHRETKCHNPRTGEAFYKPTVSVQINLKSKIDKEMLTKLTEQIKEA